MLKELLALPLTKGLDIDDPTTTTLRRRIIQEKPFLRRIYEEWYAFVTRELPEGDRPVLELGSGAGFLSGKIPGLIASDCFHLPHIQLVADAQRLPFLDESLRAVVMLDVLHHLPDCRSFFAETTRCIVPGGRLILIEPWNSTWSRWVYTNLHHEPFDARAEEWAFPPGGPLADSNLALPWILFERDRERFEREFPTWRIQRVEPTMPLRYILSGGISMRALVPRWTFGMWTGFERLLRPCMRHLGMFAMVVLERTP